MLICIEKKTKKLSVVVSNDIESHMKGIERVPCLELEIKTNVMPPFRTTHSRWFRLGFDHKISTIFFYSIVGH